MERKFLCNKKVLLRDRKRHTARHIASAHYSALSNGGGGYPIQSWWGTPSSYGGGYPIPGLDRGYPIPGLEGGFPSSPDKGVSQGTPIQTWVGVPPVHTWNGVPPCRPWWGTPLIQTWDEVTPYPDLGWSTPPHHLDGEPPPPKS